MKITNDTERQAAAERAGDLHQDIHETEVAFGGPKADAKRAEYRELAEAIDAYDEADNA